MQRKTVKISLLMIALTLSIIIPIFAVSVTAKKKGYTRSEPVYINDAVPGMTWADWSAQPWLKGSGTEEDPYMIKDLVIEVDGYQFAMMIQNSYAHFKIMKCKFTNHGIEGEERTAGLILGNVQNGVIFKNEIVGSDRGGIAVMGCLNIVIQKNLIEDNGIGIYVEWGMYTTIKQNDIINNRISGIVIASAHKNVIEKNDCSGNSQGIALINVGLPEHSSKDNIIYKNSIKENTIGVYSEDADKNDVLRNTIVDNGVGILFDFGSENNTVYHNNFVNNGIQAVDYQPAANNNWHHPYMLEGNFWADAPFGYDLYPMAEANEWEVLTPIEEEISDRLLPNRLGADRLVNPNETSYIRYGVMQLFSERMEGEAFPPYALKINGEEVLDSVWIFDEGEWYGEPGLMQLFYIKIPPYYLTEELGMVPGGYYEYHVEITNYYSGELVVFEFDTGFTIM